MQQFLDLIGRFAGRRIVVAGDVMLDELIEGSAERISPEAPVPVVEVTACRYMPGGAANVAANAAALGAHVTLFGLAGADPNAKMLRAALRDAGVTPELISDRSRPTVTKTRIVAHGQQIVRVDREDRRPISPDLAEQLVNRIGASLEHAEALVLSDYAKGILSKQVLEAVIGSARRRGVPVVVDPKRDDFLAYAGASLLTPNQREVLRASGATSVDEAGRRLLEQFGDGTALLVTRGEEGMSLFRHAHDPVHIPTAAREVYDVTGAGDTVAAVLALCLATGADLETAARLANHAAGLAVAHRGTAAVTARELLGQFA